MKKLIAPLQKLLEYRYEIAAFVAGASVLTIELIGARVIAPYFGTSTYVWTAVIGVILGALSAGYFYGGRQADKAASPKLVALLFVLAAGVLLVCLVFQDVTLSALASASFDLRIQALLASLFLFAPAAFFLGMISPYLAKLRVRSLDTVGRSLGRLEAASTVGSIAGVFLTGYWLLGVLSHRSIGFGVIIVLLLMSFLLYHRELQWRRGGLVVFALLLASSGTATLVSAGQRVVDDFDTPHARYQIVETSYSGQAARLLLTDNVGAQSGIYIGDDQLLASYNQQMLDIALERDAKNILIIGGGALTLPTALVEVLPEAQIDVVEIDEALEDVAAQYFGYRPHPRITVINSDGRVYTNETNERYDLILMDAYNAVTPPFQLTTVEALERLKTMSSTGIIVANILGRAEASGGAFLRAQTSTYRQVFTEVSVSPASDDIPLNVRQNFILTTGLNERVSRGLPIQGGQILRDDFAPVEQLLQRE